MKTASRYFSGTEDIVRPMTPRLSFSSHEKEVVRCPDVIFVRRSMRTNWTNSVEHRCSRIVGILNTLSSTIIARQRLRDIVSASKNSELARENDAYRCRRSKLEL
jgi:hypothetical protein